MATVNAPGRREGRPAGVKAFRRPLPEPGLSRFFLGGLAGTVGMMAFIYLVDPILRGRPFDASMSMRETLHHPAGTGELLVHVFNGAFILPLVFAFVSARLPGPPVARGLIWGALLWGAAQVLIIPMMGSGFFGDTGGSLRAAVSTVAGYLGYGCIQGVIADRPRAPRASSDER